MTYEVMPEMHVEFFRTERTRLRTRACFRIAFLFAAAMLIGTYINALSQPFTISMSPDGPAMGGGVPMPMPETGRAL